ncbi:hypothetical protein [Pelobacter seleniigenes]|uniref:hypothetical protein n=1 Tax=Pelobacter seleniigenes TaxID=407188 RepID=UPI0004A6AD2B|nr:hypothetical protein [Pelobacter seleniigenes]
MEDSGQESPLSEQTTARQRAVVPGQTPASRTAGEKAFDELVEREIRAVELKKSSTAQYFVIAAVFVIAICGGFYLFELSSSTPQPTHPVPQEISSSPRIPIPKRPPVQAPAAASRAEAKPAATPSVVPVDSQVPAVAAEAAPSVVSVGYAIEAGPFITDSVLAKGQETFNAHAITFHARPGDGPVAMVRLLEGIYPEGKARQRLAEIKRQVDSAFVLPQQGHLAVYVGSFFNRERAHALQDHLTKAGIAVKWVDTELVMHGTILRADGLNEATAQLLRDQFRTDHIHAQIIAKGQQD